MNKKTYMEELKKSLQVFGEDVQDEIVSDYEEHFAMGLQEGKTEDQIAQELGSIKELTLELSKLTGVEPEYLPENDVEQQDGPHTDSEGSDFFKENPELVENLSETFKSIAGFLGSMAGSVAKGAEKFTDGFGDKAGGFWEKYSTKAEDAAKTCAEKAEKFWEKYGPKTEEAAKRCAEKAEEAFEKCAQKFDNMSAEEFDSTLEKEFDRKFEEAFDDEMAEAFEECDEQSSGEENATDGQTSSTFSRFVNGAENVFNKVFDGTAAFTKEVVNSFRTKHNEEAAEAAAEYDGEDEDMFGTKRSFDDLSDEELDEELDETETDDIEGSVEEDNVTFDTLVIETEVGNVSITESEDGRFTADYANSGTVSQKLAYAFDWHQEGSTYYLSVKKQKGKSSFFKTIVSPDIDVDVTVPAGLKLVRVESMSGDIDISDLRAEQLEIKTVSGDISVTNSMMKLAEGSTMSGDIEVEDCAVAVAKFTSVSGDVTYTGTGENLQTKSTSGDIGVVVSAGAEVTASSISGDVTVRFESTDSAVAGGDGFIAQVKSTSGDIFMDYASESRSMVRSGNYVFGAGDSKAFVNTVSGDIEIESV